MTSLERPEDKPGIQIEHVLGQIDAEITQERAIERAAGWTPWLLALSITTVLGLLAAVWDQASIDMVRASSWFMTLWIVADTLVLVFWRCDAIHARLRSIPNCPVQNAGGLTRTSSFYRRSASSLLIDDCYRFRHIESCK